ncbi:MAG: hypothetical protein HDR35_08700 [Treponema sp.]|nr:hypothetical protein [Treponema sp.]MBD5447172.1 hypothetical protein [Treponema sp.]
MSVLLRWNCWNNNFDKNARFEIFGSENAAFFAADFQKNRSRIGFQILAEAKRHNAILIIASMCCAEFFPKAKNLKKFNQHPRRICNEVSSGVSGFEILRTNQGAP